MRPNRGPPLPESVDGGLLAAPLLDLVGDAVVVTDAAGTPVLLNEAARRLKAAAAANGSCDVRAGGGGPRVAPDELPLARVLRGEDVRDVVLDCRDASGATRTLRVSGCPVREGGLQRGAIIVLREVTEPDGDAAAPPGILARLPVAISAIRAADGILLWVSDRWEELFGFTREQAVGRHVSLVVAPVEHTPQERARAMTDALDADGRWSGELECLRRDGARLWTATEVVRFDDPGHGETWITVQTDATAARAERAVVSASATRWRSAFEDAPVAMALIGPDLRMTDVNARLCELTGYTSAELVDASLAAFVAPEDVAREAEAAGRLHAGECDAHRIDLRLLGRDGVAVSVTASRTLVRGPDGRVLHEIAVLHER